MSGPVSTSPTAVSLFSGAGGLDLGIVRAGFQIVVALDQDRWSVETYRRNQSAAATVVCQDILDLGPSDVRRLVGWSRNEGPDLVVGAPPAAPFSKSGQWLEWKRRGGDPAHGLIGVYARWVADLRPAFFLFESVPTLASETSPYRSAFRGMMRTLESAGYATTLGVLNAAHFGVAQVRRRLFVVGRRASGNGQAAPPLPTPTSARHRTAAAALAGLSDVPEPGELPSGKWAHLLPEVPPGDNYLYFTEERGHPSPMFRWRSRYWSFLLKLHPDRASPTIQARPGPATGPFHWENRRLRVPELKRLFAFPDDYEFAGSRSAVQWQIGNSVPPPMGEAVALNLFSPSGQMF
jgi:DNA (cytosine-5)-methyltransferase 1